jgi:hypothetical protein
VWVELPLGEVIDRITILDLKASRLPTQPGREAAQARRRELAAGWERLELPAVDTLEQWPELVRVNTALWEVEDALREHERAATFGPAFVALARSVYALNDERASCKRRIDESLGSRWREWKSYAGSGGVLGRTATNG